MFTEWPENVLGEKTEKFVISVYNDSDYYDIIKQFYSKHKIRDREVLVNHITNKKEINNCHILFVTPHSIPKLKEILEITNKIPVLTVSDSKGFASLGVLINLFIDDNKVRFEINEKAVKSSGLVMSYHLLKFAKIVEFTDDKNTIN